MSLTSSNSPARLLFPLDRPSGASAAAFATAFDLTFLGSRLQKDGQTPADIFPLEIPNGELTRENGRLAFGNYSDCGPETHTSLNSVYIQRQELFKLPDAETRVQTLFFPANPALLSIAGNLAVRGQG
jgi:hypothetical protein